MNINKYGINNMYLKQTFLMIALGAMAMTAAAQASIDTQRRTSTVWRLIPRGMVILWQTAT